MLLLSLGCSADTVPEPGRAEPVGIYVHEDLAPALPGLGQAAGLHHLTGRADGDIAVSAVVWLSRLLVIRLPVGYLRWLDVHAASRAGQRQGHLALG